MGPVREIKKAASGHGHGCGCMDCLREYNEKKPRGMDTVLLWRIVVAIVLFAAAWIVDASSETVSVLLAIVSILCAGYDRLIRMFAVCFREKRFDEEMLMGVVVVAAVAIGHSLEAAAGMILLQIASFLGSFTLEQTRRRVAVMSERDIPADSAAESAKPRVEEFLDRFSRFYTPIILLIAVIIAVIIPVFLHTTVREGIYRALVLLVIACPCSLIMSVALTYTAGIGCAAEQGILVRSTRAMDDLGSVSTVVFDQKTALEGEGLRVISVKSDRMEADMLLRIAAHACAYSDGVYAESIKAAYHDTIYIELIQSFSQEPGRGITVEVDGVSMILGVEEFVREHGVDLETDAVSEPSVYLAIDGTYAGRILLGPVAKPMTNTAVAALSWDKDRQIVMLSEDPAPVAEKFARLVGIGQYYADCTPEKKADTVQDLSDRGRKNTALLYAGDPRADAAAFAAADIGLAPAENGDGADVLVTDSAPVSVVRVTDTAKRTKVIARQSLIGILVFKLAILLLDMLGICPLWLAVFADPGMALAASVCAMRALTPKQTPLVEEEIS